MFEPGMGQVVKGNWVIKKIYLDVNHYESHLMIVICNCRVQILSNRYKTNQQRKDSHNTNSNNSDT